MLNRFSPVSKRFIAVLTQCFLLVAWSESAWAMQVDSAVGPAGEQVQSTVFELKISGGLRYLSNDQAELRWVSNLPGESTVAYGSDRKLGAYV